MADRILKPDAASFPPGTILKVFVKPATPWGESGRPPGLVVDEAPVVAASPANTAEFTGLQEDVDYLAWAAGSAYLQFRIPSSTSSGGEGGGKGISQEELEGLLEKLAVTAKKVQLGEVAGDVAGDLGDGGRVFLLQGTGAVTIKPPVNPPSDSDEVLYAEYRVRTTHPLATEGFSWYGQEPAWDESGEPNIVFAFSDDGGVTWWGMGTEAIPAGAIIPTGTPEAGDTVKFNGVDWEVFPGSSELDTGGVEDIVEAQAVLNGGQPLAVDGVGAEGDVLAYRNAGVLEPQSLLDAINKLGEETITTTGNHNLQPNFEYTVTAIEPKLFLPNGEEVGTGAMVIVQNVAEWPLRLKGRFTPASEEVTEILVYPGEVVTYRSNLDATLWIRTGSVNPPGWDRAALAAGFLAQTFDRAGAKSPLANETLYIAKMPMPTIVPVHTLYVNVGKGGAGVTGFYVAVFSPTGARLCHSENEHAAVESIGVKACDVGAGAGGAAVGSNLGWVWLSVLSLGGTAPELLSSSFGGEPKDLNAALSTSTLRVGEALPAGGAAGKTNALPLAIVPASNRGKTVNYPFLWGAAA